MKKSLLFAVLLLLACGSAGAYDFMYNGLAYITTSSNTVTVTSQYARSASSTENRYDDISGALVIPQFANYNGKSYNVTAIDNYAFAYTHGITSIEIPISVESIGYGAFMYCREQFDVTFSMPLASRLTTIGERAFYHSSVRSVSLPIQVKEIGKEAFMQCHELVSFSFDPSSKLTSIGEYAFFNCHELESIDLPNGVTSIGTYAFTSCQKMTSIHLPDNLTVLTPWVLDLCISLTSLTLPPALTTISEHALSQMYKLQSIEIPSSVTTIGNGAFSSDSSLTTITIPSSVTTMGTGVFYSCAKMKSAVIQNSMMGPQQFRGCKVLDNVTLNNTIKAIPSMCFFGTAFKQFTIPSSVTSVYSQAFQDSKIETLTVDGDLESTGGNVFVGNPLTKLIVNSSTFKVSFFPELKDMITTATFGNVTHIAEGALQDCAELETLTLPSSVQSIGNSAFSGCTKLGDVIAKMPKPIAIASSVFSGVPQHGYTDLHVVKGAKFRYEAMEVWKEFTAILEDAGEGGGQSVRGDVNGDGVVSATDISIIVNILAGLEQ